MTFTGNLEHLPLVDVMQLLHTTRKSGILSVQCGKGESRIVFSSGNIVGANHLDSKITIGQVLVNMKVITPEILDETLEAQHNAGKNRKPLIATLVDLGKIDETTARKGLKKLIEVTMVKLVGWKKGTFTLNIEAIVVSKDCTYTIEDMSQEISLDTQMVLMDALRVYDEQQRDGLEEPENEEVAVTLPIEEVSENKGEGVNLSADDLGLENIDKLDVQIPQSFSGLKTFDPTEMHRQKIREVLSASSPEVQETFIAYLTESSPEKYTGESFDLQGGQARGVVLFSKDELIKHAIMTTCKNEGILVFDVSEEKDINQKLEESILSKIITVLVLDDLEGVESSESKEHVINIIRKKKEKFPQISIIQFISSLDTGYINECLACGVMGVFNKPEKGDGEFVVKKMQFLKSFQQYIRHYFQEQRLNSMGSVKNALFDFRSCKESKDVLLILLDFISKFFERTITFICKKDLIGINGRGIEAEKKEEITSANMIKFAMSGDSIVHNVIKCGKTFFEETNDKDIEEKIYSVIGKPLKSKILLLPVQSRNKTVAVVYGDYGQKELSPVQVDALAIISYHAGIILENLVNRKKLEKKSPNQ